MGTIKSLSKLISTVIILASVGLLVDSVGPAWSAGGSISGKVTNTSNVGISGITVFLYQGSGFYPTDGVTASDGTYTISGIPTGSYTVLFEPPSSSNYVGQWYNNKNSGEIADPVSVTAPNTTSGINAKLAIGGTISGKVTNTSNAGISGITVFVWNGNLQVDNGVTASDGTYTINGVPAGSYTIEFFPPSGLNYQIQWYSNRSSQGAADPVSVSAQGTTPQINAVLAVPPPGNISGQVTNNAPAGIPNAYVYVYSGSSLIGWAETASDGTYTVTNIPVGSYAVYFSPPAGSNYAFQWYNNKSSLSSSDTVSVTSLNTTSGINAVLVAGGSISGRVTNASAVGISGVSAFVYDSSGNEAVYGVTASDGTFTIANLPAGSYKVLFSHPVGYVDQWFNNKGSYAVADFIVVTAPNTTSGINAVLAATQYTLTVTIYGIGAVTASPGTLTWNGNIGTGIYNYGTSVNLSASPNSCSTFGGWSGCTVNANSCSVVMWNNETSSVDFSGDLSNPVNVSGAGFTSIQDAFNSYSFHGGEAIEVQAGGITGGPLIWNRLFDITLSGGYSCDYSANPGATTISGTLTISGGCMTLENLILH